MTKQVERGILTVREYRHPSERLGCCLRQSMPCSPRHANVHLVAHILSHEMTLSVQELRQSFGEIGGGWSGFLRNNASMLGFAEVQVIEWGVGKGSRVAAIRLPSRLEWHHAASIWIKRIRASKRSAIATFDAARWIGAESSDVFALVSDNPFDFGEAGLTIDGSGTNARLRYKETEELTISNAGYAMTEAEKAAEKKRLVAADGICQGCGRINLPPERLTLDRIFPGVLGGRYVEGNCQLLCGPCNSRKGARTMSYLWETLTTDGNRFAQDKLEQIADGHRGVTGRLMTDVINKRVAETGSAS